MAVVSISRIQVRRGTANQGTGLPQLASGEFGWAIDTQELYIGNGSTAEGAPAVGNTKILTEKTNVFNLPKQYTYKSADDSNLQTSETVPVTRSIAERLDDRVSIRAFGGEDQTQQLQKAFYELFLKGNTLDTTGSSINKATAPVLHIEPGTYTITRTIYVPPFTTIIGAGKGKTIFKKTGDFDMFRTISSETEYTGQLSNSVEVFAPSGTDSNSVANQARNIRFENMTLTAGVTSEPGTSYLLQLDNCRDSEFKNVQFVYSLADVSIIDSLVSEREVAIGFTSKSDVVCSRNNKFIDCEFTGLKRAAYSSYTVKDNSFVRCTYRFLQQGVVLGDNIPFDQDIGAQGNTITDSRFDNIEQQAFLVPVGQGNKSQDNYYGSNVGNNNSNVAEYPVVSYGELRNFSVNDTFERTYRLAVPASTEIKNTTYYPEVEGPVVYTNNNVIRTDVSSGTSPVFRLPADTTKFYTVEYLYQNTSDTYKRIGTLSVMVSIKNDITTSLVDVVDEYDYTGNDGAAGQSISFTSEIQYDYATEQDRLNKVNPIGILAAQIKTVSKGVDGGAGVSGDIIFKITSKS